MSATKRRRVDSSDEEEGSDDIGALDRREGDKILEWVHNPEVDNLPDSALPVSGENVLAASKRIERHVIKTPCERSVKLSRLFGADVFIKREYAQSSGSFKERGAVNAMLRLTPEERKAGVIAASAGNHALGLATHGKRLGIPVRVVMPTIAPQTKIQNCIALGAEVIQHGDDFDQATKYARALGEEHGWTYIHGFDNNAVIAGQGSIGVEIVDQVPDIDAVIVPVGGGGLIAGIALAIKELSPRTQVLGVEPINYACLIEALRAGEPVTLESTQMTIADGLAVRRVGTACLPICRKNVDRVVTVADHAIAVAMLRFVELEKTIAEGAGATCIAPLLDGQFLGGGTGEVNLTGKRIVVVCCGGNVDVTMLGRIIDHGLSADGRLVRIWCMISDKPGGLAEFTRVLASTGASTKEVVHNRPKSGDNFNTVQLKVEFETKSSEHRDLVIRKLREAGYKIHMRK